MEQTMPTADFLDNYVTDNQFIKQLRDKGLKAPSPRTLRAWRAQGKIPFVKVGIRNTLIPKDFDPADRKRRK
jgi:hypothetical protein